MQEKHADPARICLTFEYTTPCIIKGQIGWVRANMALPDILGVSLKSNCIFNAETLQQRFGPSAAVHPLIDAVTNDNRNKKTSRTFAHHVYQVHQRNFYWYA